MQQCACAETAECWLLPQHAKQNWLRFECRLENSIGLQQQVHPPSILWWQTWPSSPPCTRPPSPTSSPCSTTALTPVTRLRMSQPACASSSPLPPVSSLTKCSGACLNSTSCCSHSCWPLLLAGQQARSLRCAPALHALVFSNVKE